MQGYLYVKYRVFVWKIKIKSQTYWHVIWIWFVKKIIIKCQIYWDMIAIWLGKIVYFLVDSYFSSQKLWVYIRIYFLLYNERPYWWINWTRVIPSKGSCFMVSKPSLSFWMNPKLDRILIGIEFVKAIFFPLIAPILYVQPSSNTYSLLLPNINVMESISRNSFNISLLYSSKRKIVYINMVFWFG